MRTPLFARETLDRDVRLGSTCGASPGPRSAVPWSTMGCISSSPAGADKAEGNSKRKTLGGGNLTEASTKMLGANCQTGHPLDKYDVLDTLGTGGFAVVKRVRSKMTGENFAMKIINVTFDQVRARPPPRRAGPRIDLFGGLFAHSIGHCQTVRLKRETRRAGRRALPPPILTCLSLASPRVLPDVLFAVLSFRARPRRRTATRRRSP